LTEANFQPPRFPAKGLGGGPHRFRASIRNTRTQSEVVTEDVKYFVSQEDS
jgi:hypothetical protein